MVVADAVVIGIVPKEVVVLEAVDEVVAVEVTMFV